MPDAVNNIPGKLPPPVVLLKYELPMYMLSFPVAIDVGLILKAPPVVTAVPVLLVSKITPCIKILVASFKMVKAGCYVAVFLIINDVSLTVPLFAKPKILTLSLPFSLIIPSVNVTLPVNMV